MTDQILDQINFVDTLLLPGLEKASANVLMVANDHSYIFAMIANGLNAKYSAHPLDKITDEWNIKIAPAGWAFSIWGIIYTMLGGFVYFQSHNSTEVDSAVIFDQVGYMFTFNMLANALWLFLFGHDNSFYFGLALFDIILMLVTAISVLNISTHSHLNSW